VPESPEALVEALGRAGFERPLVELLLLGPDAIPALLRAVEPHTIKGVRVAAALRVQSDRVLPRLRADLCSWRPWVAERAARAIGVIGNQFTLRLLREAHASGDPARVAQALGYLGVINDPAPLAPIAAAAELAARLAAEAVPALIAFLQHRSRAVQSAAIHALWSIGDARAVEPLLARLPEADPELKRLLIPALSILGDPRAAGPLLIVAQDASAERVTRAAALQAIGHLGGAELFEPLLAMLGEVDRELAPEVIGALGALGEERALPVLLSILDGRDLGLRVAAAWALGRLADPRALGPLVARLRDPRRVRKSIQGAISAIVHRRRAVHVEWPAPAVGQCSGRRKGVGKGSSGRYNIVLARRYREISE
jgi:HEAT repeat protein